MLDATLIPLIGKARGQTLGQPQPTIDFAQQQRAPVAAALLPVELHDHRLRKMSCKLEAFLDTLCHSQGLSVLDIASFQINQLCHETRPFAASS